MSQVTEIHLDGLIAFSLVTWCLSALFIVLRIYTRRVVISVMGPEDWVMIIAAVVSAALTGAIVA
ncbi:hypothetical protein NW757_014100, partial [Fusarium falciforme]